MKVRILLAVLAVLAVAMFGGSAWGQAGFPVCVELGVDGDDVTMTWRDEFGDVAEDYEVAELYIAGYPEAKALAPITSTGAGSATWPWDDSLETSDFAQLVLREGGDEETESRIYLAVPYEVAEDRIDMGFDTPAEAIDAGGNCPGEPADPTNQGPTTVPSGAPVGGLAGLALLLIAGAAGGACAIRRSKK